jgi:hypothetical protein
MQLPAALDETPIKNVTVVPIARLTRPTYEALRYARSTSSNVMAVHVDADPGKTNQIEDGWERFAPGVPLTIIESPYRSLTGPLLQYLGELKRVERADVVTVVLPEYVPNTWWENILHGQSAQFLKLLLLFRPGFVVVSVPCHDEGKAAGPPTQPAAVT